MKYNPYWGYGGGKPWYHYRLGGGPVFRGRLRTKSDWVLAPKRHPGQIHDYGGACATPHARIRSTVSACDGCGQVHCSWCGCDIFWKKYGTSATSTWEKREVHRRFRLQAREAIRRELCGDDTVGHWFRVGGDYLD